MDPEATSSARTAVPPERPRLPHSLPLPRTNVRSHPPLLGRADTQAVHWIRPTGRACRSPLETQTTLHQASCEPAPHPCSGDGPRRAGSNIEHSLGCSMAGSPEEPRPHSRDGETEVRAVMQTCKPLGCLEPLAPRAPRRSPRRPGQSSGTLPRRAQWQEREEPTPLLLPPYKGLIPRCLEAPGESSARVCFGHPLLGAALAGP